MARPAGSDGPDRSSQRGVYSHPEENLAEVGEAPYQPSAPQYRPLGDTSSTHQFRVPEVQEDYTRQASTQPFQVPRSEREEHSPGGYGYPPPASSLPPGYHAAGYASPPDYYPAANDRYNQPTTTFRQPPIRPKNKLKAWWPLLALLPLALLAVVLPLLLHNNSNPPEITNNQEARTVPTATGAAALTAGGTAGAANNNIIETPGVAGKPPIPVGTVSPVPVSTTAPAAGTAPANTPVPAVSATSPAATATLVAPSPTIAPTVLGASATPPGQTGRPNLTWKEFVSQDGNFSVLMPGTPEKEEEKKDTAAGPVNRYTYFVQLQDRKELYLGGYVNYPAQIVQQQTPDALLNEARDLAVKGSKAKLLRESNISLGKYPGKEWEMQLPSGVLIKARYYLVNNRLYQTLVSGVNQLPADTNRFFDSFKLTNPNPS